MHHRRIGGADGHGVAIAAQRRQQLGEAEVDHLGVTVFGQHHVGGFQIAMDDALAVSAGEAFGDLDCDLEARGRRWPRTGRWRSRCDSLSPRISSMAMKLMPSSSPTSWITAMCGMLERGGGAGFADEALAAIAVGHQLGGQDLERDVAIEARVGGAIDHAHAAAADFLDDPVMRDGSPGQ